MILFLIIFFVLPEAQAADGAARSSPEICIESIQNIYKAITPKCTWGSYPEGHNWNSYCFISCEQNDQYIGQRLEPLTQMEKDAKVDSSKYPFRFERVNCPDIESCNKEPQKCIDEQKKTDEQACKDEAKKEENWKWSDTTPMQSEGPVNIDAKASGNSK